MPEISTALIIKIIVIVVAIGGGIAVIYSVKKAVSNAIGRQLSRANDLLRTINDATEERQNNAMQFTYVDPNVVDNIKRDFPDYDENIARSIVENTVMKYFLVINGEASENQLEYCTEAFKQRAATMAKDNLSTVRQSIMTIYISTSRRWRLIIEIMTLQRQSFRYLLNTSSTG